MREIEYQGDFFEVIQTKGKKTVFIIGHKKSIDVEVYESSDYKADKIEEFTNVKDAILYFNNELGLTNSNSLTIKEFEKYTEIEFGENIYK